MGSYQEMTLAAAEAIVEAAGGSIVGLSYNEAVMAAAAQIVVDGGAGGGGGASVSLMKVHATTGTWYSAARQDNASTAFVAGEATLYKVPITEESILDGLAIYLNTVAASSTTIILVYADDGNGMAGALVKATAALDTAVGTGYKTELFADVTLPVGEYHVGVLPLGGNPAIQRAGDAHDLWLTYGNGTGANPSAAVGNDARTIRRTGQASPPNPFGIATPTSGGNNRAVVWMRLRKAPA